MVSTIYRSSTLLLATAILLTGHGLQMTLLPVEATAAGWTTAAIGLTGSAYFIGFVAGCVFVPSIVAAVGHIRSFMVMTAIAAIALLAAGLWVGFWSWLVFRAGTGLALAGLYMIIESWLSDATPRESRGAVLAVYSIISLAGMALGQALLGAGAGGDQRGFLLAAVLLCFASIPVGLTSSGSPHALPAIRFRPRALLETSPVAVVCVGLAGSVTGVFWALGPVLGAAFSVERVGLLMGLGILGGAVFHLPAGRLSDRVDRRIIIGGLAVLGTAACSVAWVYAATSPTLVYAAFFLIGAASMPLYPLCIAHACDHSEMPIVEITSGLLLINGVGAIVGPAITSFALGPFGPTAYFVYCGGCLLLAAIWTAYRCIATGRRDEHERGTAMLPRTTHAVAELALPSESGDGEPPDRNDGQPGR